MLHLNNAAGVAHQWQGQLGESLEAGEMLWLEGGLSRRTLDHLPLLVALNRLARQRADVTTPGLFIGGDGVLWTAALLQQRTERAAGLSPAIMLHYGGADQASYLAALATLPGPSAHTRRQNTTGLPVGMQAPLLPTSQPGLPPTWSSLPFVLGANTPTTDTERTEEATVWLPWVTILVVIALIFSALFV